MPVTLQSVYSPYDRKDGSGSLTETLWAEGMDTFGLSPFVWKRQLAPSYDLKEMAVWKHWGHGTFRKEYLRERQEPERRFWFEALVKAAENEDITLLHHSHKTEARITPGDTTVSYLKEFLEMEMKKHSQALPASVIRSAESPQKTPNGCAS